MTSVYYPTLDGSRIANATRTWQANEDVDVTGWDKAAAFILATAFSTSKGPLNYAYKLQWRDVTDSGSFADVASTGEISYSATTDLTDGGALESGEVGCSGSGTFQDGLESEGDNIAPDSGTYTLEDEYWTEFHWALDCSGAQDGHEYEFQLVTTGDNVIGTCAATITMATAAVHVDANISQSVADVIPAAVVATGINNFAVTQSVIDVVQNSVSVIANAAVSITQAAAKIVAFTATVIGVGNAPVTQSVIDVTPYAVTVDVSSAVNVDANISLSVIDATPYSATATGTGNAAITQAAVNVTPYNVSVTGTGNAAVSQAVLDVTPYDVAVTGAANAAVTQAVADVVPYGATATGTGNATTTQIAVDVIPYDAGLITTANVPVTQAAINVVPYGVTVSISGTGDVEATITGTTVEVVPYAVEDAGHIVAPIITKLGILDITPELGVRSLGKYPAVSDETVSMEVKKL